ncbi:hypothetical protein FD755_015865 [Muntiacus reevesi]|uniref:Mitochondrial fission factor n=1 Tax=Muntiacus reevesi TaxID=9886 RepID=A0A5N3XEB1_MUNRE|nr:hypothetical protein FD755_015865 [Muntiacus reevesi]
MLERSINILMSGAAFPSPTATEMVEISQIQYEMEYTEGISQRMMVPEKLKVASPNVTWNKDFKKEFQTLSTPFKPLALKTPPRVLTLSKRPLDFLDLERPAPTPQNEEIRAVGRLKRERSMSENVVRQNGQLVKTDSIPVFRGGSAAAISNPHHDNVRYGISNIDAMIEGTSEDMTVENKERAKREMVMYSITVAFWLLNSWLWFRR